MRIATTDALKALVLLAAMAGAGCVASWGSSTSSTRPPAAPQSFAAGGKGVESRTAPAAPRAATDDDCPAARDVDQGSTRYVYQGAGQPHREDTAPTSNLAGAAPGDLAATGSRGTSSETPGQPAGAKKPGCPD